MISKLESALQDFNDAWVKVYGALPAPDSLESVLEWYQNNQDNYVVIRRVVNTRPIIDLDKQPEPFLYLIKNEPVDPDYGQRVYLMNSLINAGSVVRIKHSETLPNEWVDNW